MVTDGPFQEFKEWAAGFQVIDVETEERALEIAALVSAVPGPGGVPLQQPIHVRRVMDDGPSDAAEMDTWLEGAGERALNPDRGAEDLLRDLAPQVVGILTRRSGDFSAAEDAVQEALVAAHTTWPRDGIPDNPRAWLVTAATRRLVDEQRSAAARRRRELDWATAEPEGTQVVQHDDSLTVLLMCCHPALSPASAVALTLRAVGGLTTAEIATAYVVPEPTMAQRISRAKRTLRDSGAAVRPAGERRARRPRPTGPRRGLPPLQRGVRREHRSRPDPHRPLRRGDPAGAAGAPAAP